MRCGRDEMDGEWLVNVRVRGEVVGCGVGLPRGSSHEAVRAVARALVHHHDEGEAEVYRYSREEGGYLEEPGFAYQMPSVGEGE